MNLCLNLFVSGLMNEKGRASEASIESERGSIHADNDAAFFKSLSRNSVRRDKY